MNWKTPAQIVPWVGLAFATAVNVSLHGELDQARAEAAVVAVPAKRVAGVVENALRETSLMQATPEPIARVDAAA